MATGLAERGVVLEGYSPFKASNLNDPTLRSIAEAHDATPAQIVVAWHVAHDFVVIPKSAQPERIVANAAGARIELTADEVAAIDGLMILASRPPARRFSSIDGVARSLGDLIPDERRRSSCREQRIRFEPTSAAAAVAP